MSAEGAKTFFERRKKRLFKKIGADEAGEDEGQFNTEPRLQNLITAARTALTVINLV